jgi:hypothetical protein
MQMMEQIVPRMPRMQMMEQIVPRMQPLMLLLFFPFYT